MSKRKIIKKGWKIPLIILAVILLWITGIYIASQSRVVQTYVTRMLAQRLSRQLNTVIHIGGVDVALFRRIILEDVWMEDQYADTLVYVRRAEAKISSLNLNHKLVEVSRLTFDYTRINISKDTAGIFNFQFLAAGKQQPRDTIPSEWRFYCNRFSFKNSTFNYRPSADELRIDDINLQIDSFRLAADSVTFQLTSLNLNDRKGFYVSDLSAGIKIAGPDVRINNLSFATPNSMISKAQIAVLYPPVSDSLSAGRQPRLEVELDQAGVSLADLAVFVPALEGMNQKIEISGKVSGNLQNLKGKNLLLKTGQNTLLHCDFSASDLSDLEQAFIFFDLHRSQTDFRDLSQIRLPNRSRMRYMKFPETFYKAGILTYQGNFTGFLTDFVAYGTLAGKMGKIKTDLSFVPGAGGVIRYNGRLQTTDFDLATLYRSDLAGKISFNGKVNGSYNKYRETLQGKFDGLISSWYINRYNYSNIVLNGQLTDKKFDGSVRVDDPNLQLDFIGTLDLNEKIPVFDFNLQLRQANLMALNLDTANTVSELALGLNANFSGNNLDNLDGAIRLTNARYRNQHDELALDSLVLTTAHQNNQDQLTIRSDFFDASVTGDYNFKNLWKSFYDVATHYLPALAAKAPETRLTNRFRIELDVKETDKITAVFLPGLHIGAPFHVSGNIDSEKRSLEIWGGIPTVRYNNLACRDLDFHIFPGRKSLSTKIRFGELMTQGGFSLYNLALLLEANNNELAGRMVWNNYDALSYSGEIETKTVFSRPENSSSPRVVTSILPSKIFIADSLWQLKPAEIRFDSSTVAISNFVFYNRQQQIAVNGKISKNPNDQLSVAFDDINLATLEYYMKQDLGLKGKVNGTVGLADLYRERLFYSDLRITGLEFRAQPLGDVSLVNKWDRTAGLINSELKVTQNNRNSLLVQGFFNPENKNMRFTANLDHLSLVFLETVIRETLSNFHGDGTGKVVISGTPDKIWMDGAVFCENAGLTVDVLQVSYHLNDSIRLARDSIIFNRIEIRDALNNRGVFNGSIRHDNFSNMDYNMTITSPKIMAMNTTSRDNEQFYGKAVASGTFRIAGRGQNVKLSGEATSLAGTAINISLSSEEEVARYDFVRFASPTPEASEKSLLRTATGGVDLVLTVNVTPEARTQLIYNSKIGDMIRAQGEGVLRFRMDPEGNLFLSGNYDVTQGDYLFTLQNVINKRFSIEQGGSIIWSGDPYNAIIDLKAVYKLKSSLRDLPLEESEGGTIDKTQRIPVDCKIHLTDELSNPTINFEVVLPTVEDRLRDAMQQFFNTPEEMNKQILSLLVLGKFYTPEYMRGTIEVSNSNQNLIGTTASELFSNQLSNWLSQINSAWDIGFNYRPGNQMTDDEIELALSTQLFNDRVTINGNVGNNANPNSTNNSELVGDFDINVKLSRNGKLQLKAYNHSNNNLIYETAPYTQGIGFTYKEDYNTIDELWRKFVSLFRKEKSEPKQSNRSARKE